MSKKKITIYCSIVLVFGILFATYMWSVLGSTDSVNEQRLQESMRVIEQQIQRNIQYKSKDLALLGVEYNLIGETQLEVLLSITNDIVDKEGEYYIIDSTGAFYSESKEVDRVNIDKGALKVARTSGYAAVGSPEDDGINMSVAIMIPLGEGSPYFLAEVVTLDRFFDILAADLSIPTEDLILFDEWGGQISVYATNADQEVRKHIQDEATNYSNNRLSTPYHKLGYNGSYCIYVTAEQPRGWFLGAKVSYAEDGLGFLRLHASSLIVFVILAFILIAVVCLDMFNDREKKKELLRVNGTDMLTGLISSGAISEEIQKAFDKNSFRGYSYVCMDIVAFSRINTMFGYTIGDQVLCIVAETIKNRQLCGARINADCFSFLSKSLDDMVEQLVKGFYEEIALKLGEEYLQVIDFKFGIYQISEARSAFREVHEGALLALKDAKRQSLQTYVIYDKSLRETTELQRNIEVNMMHALSKEEFIVYIQPQLNMPDETCTRGETLIRWNSEFMGFMPPDQFIPVFERNGFVVETDFFMLTNALELQQSRIRAGKKPITLAVNQSKVTVAFPNYYDRLKETVVHYDVPLDSIELEITESTLESSWETIVPLVHSIKKLGFSVAMDDFGSGFSSLNTLRILPIDVLKIDKGFLQESDTSKRCKTIIKNIVNMAKELSIEVVCEGAETKEQIEFLKSIHCDIVQGYYYSKPIPQSEFVEKYGAE